MRRLLLLALPLLLAACPRELASPPEGPAPAKPEPPPMAGGQPTAAREAPRDPRVAALLEGTALEEATEEERRLALKIAALDKLRREMREVLDALPAEKQAAQDLERRLGEVERRVAKTDVEKVLLASKAELKRRLDSGEDTRSLLARARAIDGKLDALVAPEAPGAEDSETVRQLKQELAKQQQATMGLAAATRVAFRALAVIEQMKLALPQLEEVAQGGG